MRYSNVYKPVAYYKGSILIEFKTVKRVIKMSSLTESTKCELFPRFGKNGGFENSESKTYKWVWILTWYHLVAIPPSACNLPRDCYHWMAIEGFDRRSTSTFFNLLTNESFVGDIRSIYHSDWSWKKPGTFPRVNKYLFSSLIQV